MSTILFAVIMTESVRKMMRAKLVVLGRDNCGKTGNTYSYAYTLLDIILHYYTLMTDLLNFSSVCQIHHQAFYWRV